LIVFLGDDFSVFVCIEEVSDFLTLSILKFKPLFTSLHLNVFIHIYSLGEYLSQRSISGHVYIFINFKNLPNKTKFEFFNEFRYKAFFTKYSENVALFRVIKQLYPFSNKSSN
jgi:hypothetical protein